MVDPEYDEKDVPAAEGDIVADGTAEEVAVPLADPDVDGRDPDEVVPQDGSTSGPDDMG